MEPTKTTAFYKQHICDKPKKSKYLFNSFTFKNGQNIYLNIFGCPDDDAFFKFRSLDDGCCRDHSFIVEFQKNIDDFLALWRCVKARHLPVLYSVLSNQIMKRIRIMNDFVYFIAFFDRRSLMISSHVLQF